MPAHWSHPPTAETLAQRLANAEQEEALLTLTLTYHNALTAPGFVWFVGATAVLMLIPILAFLGSAFLWVLLISLGTSLVAIWTALRLSWHRGRVREVMEFHRDNITLTRQDPGKPTKSWSANPYWVHVEMEKDNRDVPNYLTLKGGDRLVELGSFLSADERPDLAEDLRQVLDALARHVSPGVP